MLDAIHAKVGDGERSSLVILWLQFTFTSLCCQFGNVGINGSYSLGGGGAGGGGGGRGG